MSRPLFQLSVVDLEALAEGSDSANLLAVQHELQYRHMPKAVALLAKVNEALELSAPAAAPDAGGRAKAAPRQRAADVKAHVTLDLFQDNPAVCEKLKVQLALELPATDTEGAAQEEGAMAFKEKPAAQAGKAPASAKPKVKLRLVKEEASGLVANYRPRPIPDMPLDEAYRVLKASPSENWELIEARRRTLVLKTQPDWAAQPSQEILDRANRAANLFNDAAILIAASRGGLLLKSPLGP